MSSMYQRLLPPAASSRLSKLENLADTFQQSAGYAVKQASEIRNVLGMATEMPDLDRQQLESELREHQATQADASKRHRDAAALVTHLNGWVAKLTTNPKAIEEAPAAPFKLRKNENHKQAIARLRDEINDCKRAQHQAVIAPLPPEDLRRQAENYVERMAAQITPTPRMVDNVLSMNWSFGGTSAIGGLTPPHVFSMMAWLAPELVTQRLVSIVERMPKPAAPAMSEADKHARLSELSAQLDRLEREEESAIRAALEDGLNVVRRPDASALAVLSIRYVMQGGLKPVPRRANGANGHAQHEAKKSEPRVLLHPSKMESKDGRAVRSRH
jgi:hypothetical protein